MTKECLIPTRQPPSPDTSNVCPPRSSYRDNSVPETGDGVGKRKRAGVAAYRTVNRKRIAGLRMIRQVKSISLVATAFAARPEGAASGVIAVVEQGSEVLPL